MPAHGPTASERGTALARIHPVVKNVFVLDDDPDTAELLAQALVRGERKVRAFYDPTRALAAMRGTPVDLLIADLDMPWMDGEELIRRIREQRPDLPVLIVSGLDEAAAFAARERLLYFAKPVDLDVLRVAVDEILAGTEPSATV